MSSQQDNVNPFAVIFSPFFDLFTIIRFLYLRSIASWIPFKFRRNFVSLNAIILCCYCCDFVCIVWSGYESPSISLLSALRNVKFGLHLLFPHFMVWIRLLSSYMIITFDFLAIFRTQKIAYPVHTDFLLYFSY